MKVVIVGGVAAGMSAAARLRRLDESAEIVVFEKDEHVSFANCGLPYHIGGTIAHRRSLLVQTPESLREQLSLDVRIFTEVTAIHPGAHAIDVRNVRNGETSTEHYDKLVLTPGAKALRPPMPGLDHPAVFELRNIEDMDRIIAAVEKGARRAVVMGGYIGIEAAENLRERGLEVIIVEKMPQLMGPLDPEIAHYVQAQLELHGIQVMTGSGVTGFRDEQGRVAVLLESGIHIETDLVIFALGSQPFSDLARAAGITLGARGGILVDAQMRTSAPDVLAGGDVLETTGFVSGQPTYIPMAGPANRQGRIIADTICGKTSAYRGTQGTSVLKVFDLTVATTGLNEKALRRANIPFRKVYLHPFGHANYYPNTAQMHLKMLFSPDGARILGAQIAGYDGVDKRIDVLATAMRGKMSVQDLEHLELAYAPPYGSAKDPVNMAGFVASNLVAGDVEFWYAEDYAGKPSDVVVLDIRTANEFSAWHLPGAVNLPLNELRARVGSLDRNKTYWVYCKVGIRSYLAYRILHQKDLHARTLAGGSDTLQAMLPDYAPRLPPASGQGSCSGADCGVPTDSGEPAPALKDRGEAAGTAEATQTTGKVVVVDCRGLQCPGPIRRLAEEFAAAAVGDEIKVHASDPGFLRDAQAWSRASGHAFMEGGPAPEGGIVCRLRKQVQQDVLASASVSSSSTPKRRKKTMVVFSGDLDKVMAALIIANGALTMGDEVSLFFTFWGLSALRRDQSVAVPGKTILDRMFGWMLPRGIGRLTLSKMHMGGAGTAMMRHVMASKNVDTPQQLLQQAQKAGVRLVACAMSMDVMGIKEAELIDGVEIGGVATFLADVDESNAALFV